jgi:HEAT repeat protein
VGAVWIHVLNLSHDLDAEVRAAAAKALGTVQHEDVTARLIQLMTDPDPAVVIAAGASLENTLAGEPPQVVLDLCAAERLEVRLAAVRVLAAVRGEKAAEAMTRLIDDANWQVRRAAIRGLTSVGGEVGTKATWALMGAGEHGGRSRLDRLEALQALARTQSRPDLDRIERLGRTEEDPVLRLAAARTLLAWGDLRSITLLVELTEYATDDAMYQRTATRVRALAEETLRCALATRTDAEPVGAPPPEDTRLVRTRTWRQKLPEMLRQLAGKGVDYSPSDLNETIW